MFEDDRIGTWAQRREAELELWTDEHLAALSALQLADLDDPAVLRAIGRRAAELAKTAERLARLRGADAEEEAYVALFREQLSDI